jgi:hypothetical protein
VLVKVIRDGRRVEISIYDVVVGDVIPLNIGNQVLEFIFLHFCSSYITIAAASNYLVLY